MKKLLLVALVISGMLACQNQHEEFSQDLESSLHQGDGLNTSTLGAPPAKIDICHYDSEENTYKVLNVSEQAWPDHSSHGDVLLEDQDGDGYFPDNACGIGPMGDCDDLDPSVYPGAEEICGDGIDNDCEGGDEACIELPMGSYDASSSCTVVNVSSVVSDIEVGDEILIRFCQGDGLNTVEVCFDTRNVYCYYPLNNVQVRIEQGSQVETGMMSQESPGRHCFVASSIVASAGAPVTATIISYELGERTCNN